MKGKKILFTVFCSLFLWITPVSSVSVRAAAHAKAECVVEQNSLRVLYARNASEALPMASTTKIVTAITVLEREKDIFTPFEIDQRAVGVEGSSIYLKTGDMCSCEELLYGLMLRSGNDAAEALAYHVAGSLEQFSVYMNETAQKAGAINSCFLTPHGLPMDGHLTTAKDLCFISAYALKNEVFRRIVSTKCYTPRGWMNKNKLLFDFDGAIGVKTGYTRQAGRCLVSAAERENMTLVCTVLGCGDTYGRSKELLNDCFLQYQNRLLLSNDTPIRLFEGRDDVLCHVEKDLYYPLVAEELLQIKRVIKPNQDGVFRCKKGEIVGQIEIRLANRLIFFENLYKL